VRGDSFDWSDDGERVWLATINGMGEGVAASMLTTLATCALRNARRAGISLADQAALADQAVYDLHRGEQYLSTLLLELNLCTGLLTAVDAGSPRLVLLRDGEVSVQPLEAQFPLGMFEGTNYHAQYVQLQPGDRLFMISDGVIQATGGTVPYGETALDRMLRRTAPMAPLDAVRSLLGDLRAFVAGDLTDDAVVVCLDWFGARS
jgi:serine phosphatase RsbU (regulator of sigma subunit)